jgi:phospholipid transport system substrate-binding protein
MNRLSCDGISSAAEHLEFRNRLKWCGIFLGLFLLVRPFSAHAGAPTEQLRSTVDRVLEILQDPNLKGEAKQKERREQLRRTIIPRFDFTEMAKRSLGAEWRRRTLSEQGEFVNLFTEILQNNYVATIESYEGEKIKYLRETQDQDIAEVQTTITTSKGDTYSLNYRLHLVGNNWKVYDVVIENVSIVNNFRSQFNRVITNSSYQELVRILKEKKP